MTSALNGSSRIELRQESAKQTTLADGEADVLYSASFLEHLDDLDQALSEMARVTRAGGYG